MPILVIMPLRVPVPYGEAQPHDQLIDFDKITNYGSINFIKTPYKLQMPQGSEDGVLYVMPPPAGNKLVRQPVSGSKTVTAAGTQERLVAASTKASVLILQAKLVDAANSGSAYWGDSTCQYSVKEANELSPGESCEIRAQPGECFDLYNIYVDAANNGDGFVYNYIPA